MKRKPLLLMTILAMSIALLFTACPEPEPEETSTASAGTGGIKPSIIAGGGDDPGEITLTLIDPEHWGLRHGGTPVNKKDVMFWLFYLQDAAGDKTTKDITDAVGDAAVHTTDLASPDETKGIIQIAHPDTIRATHTTHPFVITGLKSDTQYSFFLRIVHPDSTITNKAEPKADEGAQYKRDTVVVWGTSKPLKAEEAKKPKQWYVSTLASGFPWTENPMFSLVAITATSDGTLYVADTYKQLIKKITPDGTVSPIAGDEDTTGDVDGTGTSAQFNGPRGIAVAPDGKTLYVADTDNHRIRKITIADGEVTTIAGSDKDFADGTGTSAQFNRPQGIAVAPDGTALYVADTYNHRIRKITIADGEVITIAGDGTVTTFPHPIDRRLVTTLGKHKDDAIGIKAQFAYPTGIAVAPDGKTLYVIDSGNYYIRKIALTSKFEVGTINGKLHLNGIAVAPDGNTLYASTKLNPIDVIALDGTTTPLDLLDETTGSKVQFEYPTGIAVVSSTILYVVDIKERLIRKLQHR